MVREIIIENEKKVMIEEKNEKYFVIQQSSRGDCEQYHDRKKYQSKDEAIKHFEESIKATKGYLKIRVVYVEEIESYSYNPRLEGRRR
ncbi:MAG: hypothetical protein HeimC3_48510 [Candidatus Heimdallarchaeota archaeon LC_3]|nr:MAG: hypothetical protein HeimC3_48510 [Candidatus Heimdallarchaeota archaeon LC_3]